MDQIVIRASSLPDFNDCPRRAAGQIFRPYLESLGYEFAAPRRSISAVMGDAVHRMMSELGRTKVNTGDFTLDDMREARAVAITRFMDDVKDPDSYILDTTTGSIDKAVEQLDVMCEKFAPILDTISPLRTEQEYECILSPLGESAIPVKLTGTIDMDDTFLRIHDYKTGSNEPTPKAQLGGYGLLKRYTGEDVNGLMVHWLKRKSKMHDVQPITYVLDVEDCIRTAFYTIKQVQRYVEDLLASKNHKECAFPANPMSMICTEKYCQSFCTPWCKLGA